jgi:hypothetical protein
LKPAAEEPLCICATLLQLRDIQKCNKQLSASTIKHAATRTFKDKRRALLIKALHTTADVKQGQQQQLEGYMTQTLQKELIDKVRAGQIAAVSCDSTVQCTAAHGGGMVTLCMLRQLVELTVRHSQQFSLLVQAAQQQPLWYMYQGTSSV